jgi:hypothetical protein
MNPILCMSFNGLVVFYHSKPPTDFSEEPSFKTIVLGISSRLIDFIKTGGVLVKDMHIDSTYRGMVEAITTVSDTMGLVTIVEFVENEQILKEL